MLGARVAIGFGATSRATLADVVALIERACGPIDAGTLLATIERRAPLARDVAREFGCEVVTFDSTELARVAASNAQGETLVASPRALATVGTSSVAEASALAALGRDARLVVARRTGRGCTCARAELT